MSEVWDFIVSFNPPDKSQMCERHILDEPNNNNKSIAVINPSLKNHEQIAVILDNHVLGWFVT